MTLTELPASATDFVLRLNALITALRDGPLSLDQLIAALGSTYPLSRDSARRMINRDITHLNALGIVIERSRHRPPVYTLQGGTPVFSPEDLRTLALIRDTFGAHHPQTIQVQDLLDRLTKKLIPTEAATYTRQQVLRMPLQPAIDYTPYASLLARLERATSARQALSFTYRSSLGDVRLHRMVEPYEIEYYERHFYLVAYSHNSGQIHDFRIDRIQDDASFRELHRLPPGMARSRPLITFRYRLAAILAQGEISQRFAQQRVVDTLPNGDVIIEAQGRSDFFIVRTLLKYAGNAELLDPPELREQMRSELRRMTELYGV